MAKSDILKRAMLVTTDPIGSPALAPHSPPKASTTSPGAMMAFMKDRSEVHKELESAQERLAEFADADPTKRLDPKQVRPSAWANRKEQSFSRKAFEELKNEIASAGGNVQPIKVRTIVGQSDAYEIVFGHRRHRACLELGLPVLATVVNQMSDRELFAEMDRENRARADLSVWEQGLAYARALDAGLYPSLRQLAEALNVHNANVSRAVAIAKLPDEVIRAFDSPLDLQYRWATPLRDAQDRDPEGLLARATAISQLSTRPSASEIFAQLTAPPSRTVTPAPDSREWKDGQGRRAARMSVDKKGRVAIAFEQPVSKDQLDRIVKLIDSLTS